jgi:hypothetical protein
MATKVAEIQTEMIADVQKTEDLKTLLRINWGAETTGKAEFKPAVDLKKGDKVKIIVEKI